MRLRLIVFACLTVMLAGRGAASGQNQPKPSDEAEARELGLTLSSTPEFTEGKYGTRHTTEILYVPFVLDWAPTDRFDLGLTVPYVRQHGRDIFAALGAGVRASQRVNARRRQPSPNRARTEAGLGDVLLDGSYVLLEEKDVAPELRGFATIKFPTADSSKGLGTGEFDETLGLGLDKKLGKWTPSLDAYYVFVGSPPGITLHNSVGWSGRVAYDATPSLRVVGALEGATAVVRHEPNPLDVRITAELKASDRVKLKAGVLKGLSNGSPNFGVLAGLEVSF
jgi:hypothetical protein